MNSLFILSIKQWFTFILVGSSLLNPILGMVSSYVQRLTLLHDYSPLPLEYLQVSIVGYTETASLRAARRSI